MLTVTGGACKSSLVPGYAVLPRVAVKGTVRDPGTQPRKIDPKAALNLYNQALKAGIKLPELLPLIRNGAVAGSGMGGMSRKRAPTGPEVRDRLGDLLAPKPRSKGQGRKRGVRPLPKAGQGAAKGGPAASPKPAVGAGEARQEEQSAGEDEDDDDDEGEEEEEEDEGEE
jgi:hypothetical protein